MSVELINTGKLEQAEALLDSVLVSTPRDFAARLARGTARALVRNLQGRGVHVDLLCIREREDKEAAVYSTPPLPLYPALCTLHDH